MPDLTSPNWAALDPAADVSDPLCSCALASSVRRSAHSVERSSRKLALQQLSSAVSEQCKSDSGCPLLASHCRQLLLPAIDERLRDESEAVRSGAVTLLCQTVPLLQSVGLCPLCLVLPLLARRVASERAEDVRCGLLTLLRDRCLQQAPTASHACHADCPRVLAAVSVVLVGAMCDSCPAVKRSAAECAHLLPSAFVSAQHSALPQLSAVLSGVCLLLKQRLDVRRAAVAALATLVPFMAAVQQHSGECKSTPAMASSSAAASCVRRLSLPSLVQSSAEVLSSLCVDPKLSVRAAWFGCVSSWLLCGEWECSAELWLAAEVLLFSDDEDAHLRSDALVCLTTVSSGCSSSVPVWLSARVTALLPPLLRTLTDWKASERLRGCRQLTALIRCADSGATSAHLDDVLPLLCRCLLDDDRTVREMARMAVTAGAEKWSAQHCIAAVQRCIETVRQQQQSGQSELVAAALMALDALLAGSQSDGAVPQSSEAINALLALLELLLPHCAFVPSPPSSDPTSAAGLLSASSFAPLLSLMRRAASCVHASQRSLHSMDDRQPCHTSACQQCRLFMTLHALDCCMEEAASESTDGLRGQQQRHSRQCDELHDELMAIIRAVNANSSLYDRCLPRVLGAFGQPTCDADSAASVESRLEAAVVPPSLLLWLRRSVDVTLNHWHTVLRVWGAVLVSRSSAEADRARVVACVAAFLSEPTRAAQLTSSQRASLIRAVLLPGCEWRPGAVNAVVRLHSLSCLHTTLTHTPPLSEAALGADYDAASESAASMTKRLLAALRSHVDDEQAGCRTIALSCIQLIAVSTRGSHIQRMDGTTHIALYGRQSTSEASVVC